MKFEICFIENIEAGKDTQNLRGKICIGNIEEPFESSMSYWSKKDYLSQWNEGLNRIIKVADKSAIVTSMYDPKNANFIIWWVLYSENNTVFIQNQILFLDEISSKFDETTIYKHIPERITVNDDGQKISEWKTSIKSLQESSQILHMNL